MPIYNPATGKPFRTGTVARKQAVKFRKILRFDNGAIADFTRENLVAWMDGDAPLKRTVMDCLKLPPRGLSVSISGPLMIVASVSTTGVPVSLPASPPKSSPSKFVVWIRSMR